MAVQNRHKNIREEMGGGDVRRGRQTMAGRGRVSGCHEVTGWSTAEVCRPASAAPQPATQGGARSARSHQRRETGWREGERRAGRVQRRR